MSLKSENYKILLNNKIFKPTEKYLPCLISYPEKVGGSHFSVSFITNLFLSGSKILFLTAYPFATEMFLAQIKNSKLSYAIINSEKGLAKNKNKQAILIKSGNEDLFIKAINVLKDIAERVIFVKNIETFNQSTIRKCLELDNIIISGDIDKSLFKKALAKKKYLLKITFGMPQTSKYIGHLKGKETEGLVGLKKI